MIPLEINTLFISIVLLEKKTGYILRVGFVDTRQSGGSFQVRVNDHDFALVLFLAGLVEDCRDGFSELNSTCAPLF